MKNIPKKNIHSKIRDIRVVEKKSPTPSLPPTPMQAKADEALWAISQGVDPVNDGLGKKRAINWKGMLVWGLILAVFGGGFLLYGKYFEGKRLMEDIRTKFSEQKIPGSLNFGFSPADADYYKVGSFSDFIGKVMPVVEGGFSVYANMAELATKLVKVSEDINAISEKLPTAVLSGIPGDVLEVLKLAQTDLRDISETVDKIDDTNPATRELVNFVPAEYLNFKYRIKSFDDYLTKLISWLDGDRTVFVFLQNPSEMRPTGGFWGSFAQINLNKGTIATSTVKDINEIDRTLGVKYVPPKELYGIDTALRLANANWFLDFPKSGELATNLINTSGFASTSKIKADLILAVSSNFIQNVLEVVGPVSIRDGKMEITSKNFIPTLQAEVQKGHDIGSKYSKEVLQEVQGELFSKLKQGDSEVMNSIFEFIYNSIINRDIVFYSASAEIQSIFEEEGFAGASFDLPKNFNGDYLATSFANIGGAKTDYVISQKVSLDSQISVDGTINNKLEIERKHSGNLEKDWWYKATNQVYGRVYLPIVSDIFSATGGFDRTIYPRVNYKKYATSTFIGGVEETENVSKVAKWLKIFTDGNKNILGFWMKVESGKTAKLSLEYSRTMRATPANGGKYTFVFDKQPGVVGSVHFSITAPAGYVFEESNSPVYEFEEQNELLPGRVAFNLTFRKEE